MPKTDDAQLSFFPTTDDVVRQTRETADEKAWRKARRRASRGKAKTPLPEPPMTGPCCLRCRRWEPPQFADDEYGTCRHLSVATEHRPAFKITKGQVITVEDARYRYGMTVERLRTAPGFSCSAFDEREAA